MAIDGIGKRNVVAEGDTDTTGRFVVEEVESNEGGVKRVLRRLYFMKNQNVIQSEVALKSNREVDLMHLAFDYHKHLVAGFVALVVLPCLESPRVGGGEVEKANNEALVIGLGGGGLPSFLRGFLPTMKITAVDLDDNVMTIATSHFGFKVDDKMTVRIGDGLKVMAERPKEEMASLEKDCSEPQSDEILFPASSMSLIVIDVDSKDTTVGMSCPPVTFISIEYLNELRSLLRNDGVLALNVSARDPTMLDIVRKNVRSVFDFVFTSNVDDEEDLNVVIFARKTVYKLSPKPKLCDGLRNLCMGSSIEDKVVHELEDCILAIKDQANAPPLKDESKVKSGNSKRKSTKKKKGKKQ